MHHRKSRVRRGILTLEWILLITVVVLGIIGGLGAIRNATNGELIDLAEAIQALNIAPAPAPPVNIEQPGPTNNIP